MTSTIDKLLTCSDSEVWLLACVELVVACKAGGSGGLHAAGGGGGGGACARRIFMVTFVTASTATPNANDSVSTAAPCTLATAPLASAEVAKDTVA